MNGFEIKKIDKDISARISGVTYPENAKLSLDQLRYLKVRHIGFDGMVHDGELICASALAEDLLSIFEELFEAGYEIEKVCLADEYSADDDRIMADNASTSFNYRFVANTTTLSLHGLGRAIDINPLYNPYIQNGVIMPANAVPYADRNADFRHKIDHDDICFKIFTKHGWSWGGDWQDSPDYQHFYKPEGKFVRAVHKLLDK